MFRRTLIGALLLVLAFVVAAPSASADEPLPKGVEGTFELHGTNGYKVFGLIGSTGKAGVLSLFVDKPGASAAYFVHGEVSREHVHFDLGQLGEIDVAVLPTGRMETVGSQCGKSQRLEGEEYLGTIAFHGEEGFTEADATSTPLELEPILNLVCAGGVGVGTESGRGLPGAQLRIAAKDGPWLRLNQNHLDARVVYDAHMSEMEGQVRVKRTVTGRLGAAVLHYDPTLTGADFSGRGPFSGAATYDGKHPPHEARPAKGTWRGDLRVDFPGHAGIRLAGPGFSASIVHANRTDFHG